MRKDRSRRFLAMAAVSVFATVALSGCSDGDETEEWRQFRIEFANLTTDELIHHDISGYVYDAVDRHEAREGCDTSHASCPRAVQILDLGLPGERNEKQVGWDEWGFQRFEAYLSTGASTEFREFPVDATKCPGVNPVTLKVTARDSTAGGVAYEYDFNCPS